MKFYRLDGKVPVPCALNEWMHLLRDEAEKGHTVTVAAAREERNPNDRRRTEGRR